MLEQFAKLRVRRESTATRFIFRPAHYFALALLAKKLCQLFVKRSKEIALMTQPNPRPTQTTKTTVKRQRRASPALPLALTALLGIGAAAAATGLFSGQTQAKTQKFADDLGKTVNASGVATVQQTDYQKGFANSTQTMLLTLDPKSEQPTKVIVTNHIKHGPFPGMQAVGQAVIDTEFKFQDPKLQAQYEKAFPNEKPRLHTLVGLGGDSTTQVTVPAGNVNESGSTVAWKQLGGVIKAAGNKTMTDLLLPEMTMTDKGETMKATNLRVVGDSTPVAEGSQLTVGNTKIEVGEVVGQMKDGAFTLKNADIQGQSKLTGSKYESLVQYNIGEVKTADVSLKNMQFHLGLRNLERQPLERIMALISQASQASRTGKSMPDLTEAQQKQLEADAKALLAGNPKITLDRLSVAQPSGDIVFTGELSAPKLAQATPEDLNMAMQMPVMMMGMVNLHLEGKANEQALKELLSLGGEQASGLSDSINDMVDAGYVVKSGNQISTTFDIKDSAMLLNGKPLQ